MFVVTIRYGHGLHVATVLLSHGLEKTLGIVRWIDQQIDFATGDFARIYDLNPGELALSDDNIVFQRLRRENDWLETWADEKLRQSLPPAGKLSLAEAQETKCCRICGNRVYVALCVPQGCAQGQQELGQQGGSDPVILDYGKEFAHQSCLEKKL